MNIMKNPGEYKFNKKWLEDLDKPSHRKYYTGFYFNDPDKQIYESSAYIRKYDIVGVVKNYDTATKTATIEQRNKVFDGDTVEVLRPVGDNLQVVLKDMKDSRGNKIESAPSAQMLFDVTIEEELQENDIVIKSKEDK
ncbi:hypothetical protein M918_11750 [Clostridium sp. BL8]|nr:hypothetical protein M918_11750 [Clostridium sp. BL8]